MPLDLKETMKKKVRENPAPKLSQEKSDSSKVRTRFAPSPTGPLHMGNARTALFNYLFAKNRGGDFILRIEDTDRERSKPEWEKDIFENLLWLGLEWDEGPIPPRQELLDETSRIHTTYSGDYGPYRQSERGEVYKKYLQQLLDQKKAYWCFCTSDELEAQRQYQISIGQAPKYTGKCRTLSEEEREKRLEKKQPAVLRFAVEQKIVTFEDLIRGKIQFDTALIGDIVIAKDITTPLYNFSVVIDDYEMHITHVIRGEDHISNTPKQILLQEAFGFPRVKYAHLPLILGEDRTKLSKRHGDISVTRFRKAGYLPEAVVNFLALLGWNPGDEREIFSLQSLTKEFSLEKIQKGGAVCNMRRLDWINGFYIRQKSKEKLTELSIPYLKDAGLIEEKNDSEERENSRKLHLVLQKIPKFIIKETGEEISIETIQKIVALYQERLKKLSEIGEVTDFFFKKELSYPKELLLWKDASGDTVKAALHTLEQILSQQRPEEWTKENLAQVLLKEAEKARDRGYLLWPLRVALTGKQASAGPFEIAEILGKEKTLQRIQRAKEIASQ